MEGAEGYVIQYAANSKFKKAKTTTVKGGDTTQRIIKTEEQRKILLPREGLQNNRR